MNQNNNLSTFSVSKEASNAIKGLLILLIVLGHNSILCGVWDGCATTDKRFIWQWLYTFHVYCFFLLPFMYNKQPYRKGNIGKNALRLLYPYVWVCLVCLLIILFVIGAPFNGLTNLLYAMTWGSDRLLEENLGLNFSWFLPAMFSLLLLKDIYYSTNRYWKGFLLGIGVLLWVVVLVSGVKFSTLGIYVPFALVPAFRLLPVCLATLWIAERIKNNAFWRAVVVVLFALTSFLYWWVLSADIRFGRMLFYFVMPVLAFLTLLAIKDYLGKSRLLIALGKMSMQIYLYHVIIFNALLLVVKHFHCPPTIADGVVVLLVTLVVSYVMSLLTTRVPWIKRLIYPEVKKKTNNPKP